MFRRHNSFKKQYNIKTKKLHSGQRDLTCMAVFKELSGNLGVYRRIIIIIDSSARLPFVLYTHTYNGVLIFDFDSRNNVVFNFYTSTQIIDNGRDITDIYTVATRINVIYNRKKQLLQIYFSLTHVYCLY